MNGSSSRLKGNQNIQVYVRVRPINERERMIRSTEVVAVPSHREVIVRSTNDNKTTKKFTFDRTFGPESQQSELYQYVVHPLIEEVLAGYNCTVFAYGQTGTGKTHTMVGEEVPTIGTSWDEDSDLGIIPRALSHLFEELRLMEVEFSMRISYLELYNEELCDLLSTGDTAQIRIYDDASKKGSIIVQGLEEIPVHNTADVFKLLAKGQEKRKTASTLMNAQSSRSHTIFSILVHIKENGIDGEELVKIGKLNLVDLAGSENVSKAGNEKGIRTRESVNINQSLLTLGRVITALVERTPHIPYRESKLTRLLQESLGGRTKTSIIATISPGCKDSEETLSTLEYAHRAKNIQNKPEINQKLFKKTVLKAYTEEIDRLKRDLMAARDKNGIYLPEETYNEMHYRIDTQNRELSEKMGLMKALKDEMASKIRLFNEVSLNLVDKTEELTISEKNLSNTQSELGKTKEHLNSTRRKYQVQKELLKNHMNTEEMLTAQASELLNVATNATSDTYRLHESIERRNMADKKLFFVWDTFTAIINDNLNNMNGHMNELQEKNQLHTQAMHKDIFDSKLQNDKFSNDALLNMKLLLELNQRSHDDFGEHIGSYQTEFKRFSIEQQSFVKNLMDAMAAKQKLFVDNLRCQFDCLTQALDKQKEMLNNHHLNIIQKIHEISLNINTFCNNQTTSIGKLSNDIRQSIDDNRLILTNCVAKSKGLDTQLDTLVNELSGLLTKLQLLQNDHQQNNQCVTQVVTNLTVAEETIQKDENDAKVEYEMNRIMFEEQCGNIIANVDAQNNDYLASQLKNTGSLCDTQKAIDENVISFMGDVLTCENSIDKQIDDMYTSQQNILVQIQGKEKLCYDQIVENGKHLITQIVDENERHNSCTGEFITSNHKTEEIVQNYCSITSEHVADCLQKIEEFQMNDVQPYCSTGETPAKRNFNYPTSLVATSPHERIIKRFWNNINALNNPDSSMAFSELDEHTLLDVSNDMLTNVSTSSFLCPMNESIPLQEKPLNIVINNSSSNSNNNNNTHNIHSSDVVTIKPIQQLIKTDYFASSNNKENNRENSKENN